MAAGVKAGPGEEIVTVPAVMVSVDPALPLSPQQASQWVRLQDEFESDAGNPGPAADDAEYYARWQTAQQKSDDLFRARFGNEAFLQQSMAAYRQSGGG